MSSDITFIIRPDHNRLNSRSKYSGRQNIYSSSGQGGEFGGGLGNNTSFNYRRIEGQGHGQGGRRNSMSNNMSNNMSNSMSNSMRPMSSFQSKFEGNTAPTNRPASSGYDYVETWPTVFKTCTKMISFFVLYLIREQLCRGVLRPSSSLHDIRNPWRGNTNMINGFYEECLNNYLLISNLAFSGA